MTIGVWLCMCMFLKVFFGCFGGVCGVFGCYGRLEKGKEFMFWDWCNSSCKLEFKVTVYCCVESTYNAFVVCLVGKNWESYYQAGAGFIILLGSNIDATMGFCWIETMHVFIYV